MKKTKFLPLALAMVLTTTMAFADTSADAQNPSAESKFSLTVPTYLNITANPTESAATSAEISGDYSLLTLTGAPATTFTVINNVDNRDLFLVAKTESFDALGVTVSGTGESQSLSYKIAFANTQATESRKATDDDIQNALGIGGATPATESNKNVIAFDMTVGITPSHGGVLTATSYKGGRQAQYVVSSGKYEIACAVQPTSLANTFSPRDEDGLYKTTLTLTNASF